MHTHAGSCALDLRQSGSIVNLNPNKCAYRVIRSRYSISSNVANVAFSQNKTLMTISGSKQVSPTVWFVSQFQKAICKKSRRPLRRIALRSSPVNSRHLRTPKATSRKPGGATEGLKIQPGALHTTKNRVIIYSPTCFPRLLVATLPPNGIWYTMIYLYIWYDFYSIFIRYIYQSIGHAPKSSRCKHPSSHGSTCASGSGSNSSNTPRAYLTHVDTDYYGNPITISFTLVYTP